MCANYVEYGNSNCILDQFGQNFTNANCGVVEFYISANGQVSLLNSSAFAFFTSGFLNGKFTSD